MEHTDLKTRAKVVRSNNVINITIEHIDEYAAMQVFDTFKDALDRKIHHVTINIILPFICEEK